MYISDILLHEETHNSTNKCLDAFSSYYAVCLVLWEYLKSPQFHHADWPWP